MSEEDNVRELPPISKWLEAHGTLFLVNHADWDVFEFMKNIGASRDEFVFCGWAHKEKE